MTEFLTRDILEGLREAEMRSLRRGSRLCVHSDGTILRVLRRWEGGFALDAAETHGLRGFVDLFDGPRYLARVLVVASEIDSDELICEIKSETVASDRAPLDFERDADAPVAYLTHG